jgi:hypothetical protein
MLRVRTADATLDGKLELQTKSWAGSGELRLQAPGLQANASGSLSESRARAAPTWPRPTSPRRSAGWRAGPGWAPR